MQWLPFIKNRLFCFFFPCLHFVVHFFLLMRTTKINMGHCEMICVDQYVCLFYFCNSVNSCWAIFRAWFGGKKLSCRWKSNQQEDGGRCGRSLVGHMGQEDLCLYMEIITPETDLQVIFTGCSKAPSLPFFVLFFYVCVRSIPNHLTRWDPLRLMCL